MWIEESSGWIVAMGLLRGLGGEESVRELERRWRPREGAVSGKKKVADRGKAASEA